VKPSHCGACGEASRTRCTKVEKSRRTWRCRVGLQPRSPHGQHRVPGRIIKMNRVHKDESHHAPWRKYPGAQPHASLPMMPGARVAVNHRVQKPRSGCTNLARWRRARRRKGCSLPCPDWDTSPVGTIWARIPLVHQVSGSPWMHESGEAPSESIRVAGGHTQTPATASVGGAHAKCTLEPLHALPGASAGHQDAGGGCITCLRGTRRIVRLRERRTASAASARGAARCTADTLCRCAGGKSSP
jgi:hypothetical protein